MAGRVYGILAVTKRIWAGHSSVVGKGCKTWDKETWDKEEQRTKLGKERVTKPVDAEAELPNNEDSAWPDQSPIRTQDSSFTD